jgi:transcriptional regulator with PAS, ATPase and Fis domain
MNYESNIDQLAPSEAELEKYLKSKLPGTSSAISKLRRQILDFSTNPLNSSALLLGPVGIGKSVIARLIAASKRVAPLDPEAASIELDALHRTEGPGLIDLQFMPWYIEFATTGLDESLASSQLFGYVPGAFSGAQRKGRVGIFEQAAEGQSGKNKGSGAALTGGVVFLDEIADLPSSIQAKLLPVLSGGAYYPVGGEGDTEHRKSFHGITIAATWKELTAENMRKDLLSRLSGSIITIPSLRDRSEDIPDLARAIESDLLKNFADRLESILIEPGVDQTYYKKLKTKFQDGTNTLDEAIIDRLTQVDWSTYSETRTLTQVVKRLLIHRESLDVIIESLGQSHIQRAYYDDDYLITELLSAKGTTISQRFKSITQPLKERLKELVKNPLFGQKLSESLDISISDLKKQIDWTERDRRNENKGKS